MLGLPTILLLWFSVIASVVIGILRGIYAKTYNMGGELLWIFNLLQHSACFICLLIIFITSGSSFGFSWFSVLLGACMAAANILQLKGLLKAQSCGSFAYTVVIISLSSIIPTFTGPLFYQESIKISQCVGVLFMIICMILSTNSEGEKKKGINMRWMLYCALAFIATGSVGVIQKVHQKNELHREEMVALLMTCFFISILYSGIKLFLMNRKKKTVSAEKTGGSGDLRILVYPVICGLCFAFPHSINLLLSGKLPSVVFFPLVNLLPMLLTMLYSILILKEKLSRRRWIGIGMGLMSTIFVSGILNF